MAALRPRLSDVFIRSDFMADPRIQLLSADALAALVRIMWCVSATKVWTYTEPDPKGAIPDDNLRLSRIAHLAEKQWLVVRTEIEQFFKSENGNWILEPDWIAVFVGTIRPPISASLRSAVMGRDNYRCVYCGTPQGPFDCDHIIPVSRGGETSLDNLVCACANCNRTKRDQTPEEWLR